MRVGVVMVAVVALAALTGCPEEEGSSSSSSSGGTGAGCTSHRDCPGGFACRLRECLTTCNSSTPYSGGCVANATCAGGQCTLPTACSVTSDCAYDKGEVCRFSTGQCTASTESCEEGEIGTETTCQNGFLCHVKVCHVECEGAVGCPSGRTCVNHACQ
jgi:hypothetical protein